MFGHRRVQIVEADAVVDRHAAHRPRVMREDPQVSLDVVALLDGRGEERHTTRHAVQEVVVHVGVDRRVVERRPVAADPHHEPSLVAVRAGHIRSRRAQRNWIVEVVAINRRGTVDLAI